MTDETTKKLALLKKGLIEERKKTSDLQKENEALLEKLSQKESQISNLKNEIQSLNDGLKQNDPKAYYDNYLLTTTQPSFSMNIPKLKEELTQLKNKNLSFQEQNSLLKTQLENITVELDSTKSSLTEQIQTLQNRIQLTIKDKDENKLKLQVMTDLHSEFDNKIHSYENEINELTNKNNSLTNELHLQSGNFSKQINILTVTIQHLMEDIEIKTNDIEKLKKVFEDKEDIAKDFHFKGTIFVSENELKSQRKKVDIYFGKYEEAIVITIQNIEKILQVKDIIDLRQSTIKNTLIKIIFKENGKEIMFYMEFTQRECKYILKFYNEMKNIYNKMRMFVSDFSY